MRKYIFAAAVAAAVVAVPAVAIVTFDPVSGTGFAGKGDVQLAFGWNNAQFQSNSPSVTFAYEDLTTYTAVCSWTTGKRTHTADIFVTRGINSTVLKEQRKNAQWLGWDLRSFDGTDASDQPIPKKGDACSAEGANEKGTLGEVTAESSGGGTLYAVLGNDKRAIWPPAI